VVRRFRPGILRRKDRELPARNDSGADGLSDTNRNAACVANRQPFTHRNSYANSLTVAEFNFDPHSDSDPGYVNTDRDADRQPFANGDSLADSDSHSLADAHSLPEPHNASTDRHGDPNGHSNTNHNPGVIADSIGHTGADAHWHTESERIPHSIKHNRTFVHTNAGPALLIGNSSRSAQERRHPGRHWRYDHAAARAGCRFRSRHLGRYLDGPEAITG
jgi:hypothetical protein